MRLVAVVAVADNGVIGHQGKLPWHLPADLAHFKRVTMGKPILMGARTWRSIGRPLPGRLNVVISRKERPEGALRADTLDEALALPEVATAEEVMIVGGAKVYEEALPRCEEVRLTRVHASPKGDTFFNFDESEWERVEAEERPADSANPIPLTFERWKRR